MTPSLVSADLWTARRRRADELRERWPFAGEVLALYRALLGVQEHTFASAQAVLPDPSRVAAYTSERVLPRVIEVSIAHGPERLRRALLENPRDAARLEAAVRRWLVGEELGAVDRYLARAGAGPVLEALGPAAGEACAGPRDERHCPNCGGLPQLSWFGPSPEDLVTAHRYLECGRCGTSWPYPRMTCAACGENDTSSLAIFGEEGTAQAEIDGRVVRGAAGARRERSPEGTPRFPHIRIDGCWTCSRYLLSIDVGREARAVPVVDELSAIPLDLYAKERGMTKILSNLMGY